LPATSFKSWELLLLDAILLWGQMRAMRRHLSLHKTCDSKQATYSMVEEGFRKFFPPVPASMYVIREKVWVVCAKQREGKLCNIDHPGLTHFPCSRCITLFVTLGRKQEVGSFTKVLTPQEEGKGWNSSKAKRVCKVWITHKINVLIFWSFNFSLLLLGC
jgi:hypothetical protein